MRVLTVTIPPGVQEPFHAHRYPSVIYDEQQSHLIEYLADGQRFASRTSQLRKSSSAASQSACDLFITVTARFRLLHVFVVLDVGTRRIVHWNVTEHPTADWTIQQCRTAITGDTMHRFLIHDRDAIYAPAVDGAIRSMGLRVLKTPHGRRKPTRSVSG